MEIIPHPAPSPLPAAFCVFCGVSVLSVFSSAPFPKRAGFRRGERPFALTEAPRQSGQGTPRPYLPATFCVFGGLSVSSVVSPRRPQNPRGGFVGANGRSPLQRHHAKAGEARLAPTCPRPSVFSVVFLCLLWFPRAIPKSRGGFVGACALTGAPRHAKGGRGTPRPYPRPSVFSVVFLCLLCFPRAIPKTRGGLCRGARPCALTGAPHHAKGGRGTPRPYLPATFCVSCGHSVLSVFSSAPFPKRAGFRRGERPFALTLPPRPSRSERLQYQSFVRKPSAGVDVPSQDG